ncbi:MAG TPA: DUF433 domain-containing protein [Chthoniobacteraceae bacterium]|nr:DUF433 domain-containing protein [Chthoniobacteraceae bacterium]
MSYPTITRIPGVCGGKPIVGNQRMPVHEVICRLQLGSTESELLESFPTLRAEHIAECLAYYEEHRDEIEKLIAADEASPNAEQLAMIEALRARNEELRRTAAS